MAKDLFMSISRCKKLEACTLQYWATYHKPIPQLGNDGSKTGNVCHSICEQLLNLKRKKYTKKILKSRNLYCIKSLKRYTILRCEVEKLDIGFLDKINKYCLVALENDFYCEDGILESAEKEFRIESDSPRYKIMGYIDKRAKFGISKVVFDYKSQKKQFEGEDITINSQGLAYCLATLKEDPTCEPEAKFIFLQFPDNPIFIFKPTKTMLTGFEYYLEYMYSRIENFLEKDKLSDLAYNKPYKKNEFSGRLLCGRTRKPGELKKDGITPAWECFCKWPMDYFVTIDKDSRERPYFTKEEIKLKDGEKIESRYWPGCPIFNCQQSNIDD